MDDAETVAQQAPGVVGIAEGRPGAVFLRADLQVHTPIDPAFEPGPEPRERGERLALAERYLSAAKERGIQLVGITEHNDVSWIDELRAVARKIGLHLLPGFEVESAEGIHVLCLFDSDTPVRHLESTLARLGLTAAKREKSRLELRTSQHFADLVKLVQDECDGVCIAAHITSNKGLLTAVREGARVDAWKTKHLLAAQIPVPPEEITGGNRRIICGEEPIYARERLPGYVLTSDARSLEGIGSVSTWIKMDTVGVAGLRQAFLDPESRIAYSDPTERRRGARILAASWEGGVLDGVSFPLNPELNCLIGGRGAGKSTVIETIRYALGARYHLPDFEATARGLLKGAFPSGSKVSLLIETDGPKRRFVIERTAPHAPIVRNPDGTPCPELDATHLIGLRVFGQKEIYDIAQNEKARLEMLDAFAAEELRDVLLREAELVARCEENATVVARLSRQIDDSQTRLAELPALEDWRARFREAGFDELLEERRQLDREGRLLDGARADLRGLAERVAAVGGGQPPLPETLDRHRVEGAPNTDLLERARAVLEEIDRVAGEKAAEIEAQLARATGLLDEIQREWDIRREARSSEFDQALRKLQERMPDVDPARYLDVERRIEQLIPLKTALESLSSQLAASRRERAALLVELEDARGAKHRARLRAAERMNDALGGSLRIDLQHQGVRDSFVDRLVALKSGARQDSLRTLVARDDFSPVSFARAVREHRLAEELGMPEAQAGALERALDEGALMDLEAAELPDGVSLALDVSVAGGRPDYRDLSRLSPGQKSTAILLLALQENADPLLIDQPEDDLDNRFIYDDIVKRLKRAKPERQFVIATHNANIPVSGDAEQIVVLDAEERGGTVKSFVRAAGSIDADEVRLAAERILEGGEEAFALRRAKYET